MVDKLGRRTTLLISAGFALLGGLLQTVAVNLAMIYTGRFISGLAVGMSLVAAPLYIAEIAPKQLRGTLGYTIQINIGLGTVVASTVRQCSFRCILAMQIIPAFVIATGMWFSPTSPRWLIHRNREKSARYNLARLRGLSVDDPRISEEIESIQQSINMDNDAEQAGWRVIIDNGMWRRLLLACGAGALLQLNGINAVTYYSPDILRMSGITDPVQQLALTIATTVSNVVGAIIGTTIVDRYGRRAIMVTGGMLMGVALVAISVLLATHDENERGRTTGYSVLALECLYIAAFAFSWGAITWIYVSEIFPQYVRGKAMTVAAIVCWTCNFCVSQISPLLLSSIGWATFVIYGGICLIGSTWEFFVFPETKQQSIEDIARMFTKKPRNPA
ncbi:general substrate transporter [Syncephalis plumigaleata]|nr:general substrate transporter [Syncephalis plumigaleata]